MQPFYERAMSKLDRSMHRSLWALFAHSSFIEVSHMTKNTDSELPPAKNKILNRTQLQNQTVLVGRVNRPLFFSRQNWLLRQKKNFEEKMS